MEWSERSGTRIRERERGIGDLWTPEAKPESTFRLRSIDISKSARPASRPAFSSLVPRPNARRPWNTRQHFDYARPIKRKFWSPASDRQDDNKPAENPSKESGPHSLASFRVSRGCHGRSCPPVTTRSKAEALPLPSIPFPVIEFRLKSSNTIDKKFLKHFVVTTPSSDPMTFDL